MSEQSIPAVTARLQRRTMSVADWRAEGERRFGPNPRDWKFVCPMCGTVQSAHDFHATGKFKTRLDGVSGYLGFTCVGRFTGQGDQGIAEHNAGRPWNKGCNWTLGGLFQVHTLEVIDEEGQIHPRFEFAPATEGVKP